MNRVNTLLSRCALPSEPTQHLSGGMMGEVYRCGDWVVKTHPSPPPGLFPAEARGLRALADVGVRTPTVRYADEDGIVMRFLHPGKPDPSGLAEQLARLHRARGPEYGSPTRVFLGRFALPTIPMKSDWLPYWAQARIRPLVEATRQTLGRLASRVETLLTVYRPPIEGPSLLHGDLWNGNVVMAREGATLIDPSVWYGERAVDLAMMRLFGGFGRSFWSKYEALCPIPKAVEESIPYYQLYYLLVHVHFFGAAYCQGVDGALRHYDC